jgi:hypothetical protein
MAWAFSLAAECGEVRADAERFCQHFHRGSWTLSNGLQSQSQAEIFQDVEENWWGRICPSGISATGIDNPETAYLMTELGILLYQQLQSAPGFRYALVGVEVDEFRTYEELSTDAGILAALFPGLVLAEAVWQSIGSPLGFRPFARGYVWQPYAGEAYQPLRSSIDLSERLDRLSLVQ